VASCMVRRRRLDCASGGCFNRGGLPSAYGVIKEYAKTDTCYLDFDDKKPPHLLPIFVVFRLLGSISPRWVRYDRTRRGWHVVIKLSRSLTPVETVALQAVLGSDSRRESLNLMRVLHGGGGDKRWNILYSRKLR
jgi:hypothetical protein